jgi:hypothetical protein
MPVSKCRPDSQSARHYAGCRENAVDSLAQIPSIPIFVKKYAMKVVDEDIVDKIDITYPTLKRQNKPIG